MLSFEDAIASQIVAYETKQRLENVSRQPGRGMDNNVAYGPYLHISRDQGSGGHTVAQLLGQRLEWNVFDREIVDAIAQRSQVSRDLIERMDERQRALGEELLTPTLRRGDIGQLGYYLHLKQVVLALGRQGSVVIVGRGVRHILPALFGLRVRLVAPLALRVERIAAERGLRVEEVRKAVQQCDRDRAAFIRHHFHSEVGDPLAHDLVINTADLSCEKVAEIVLAALYQKLGVTPPVSS